jgi:hypothetical protein
MEIANAEKDVIEGCGHAGDSIGLKDHSAKISVA